MNLIFFLKRDVEIAGVENLAKLHVHRAQHLVLVEMRTDGLPDFGEQLVFLGSPLRFVHYDIVFQGQGDLQREADEQPQIRRAEHAPFRVREKDDPEIVLPRLQAHRHQVGNSLCQQRLLADLELSSRKRRQRLFQFPQIPEGDHTTTPVGKLGDVIARLLLLQFFQKLRGKALLHRGHGATPLLGNKKDSTARRQRRYQPLHKGLQSGHQVGCGEQASRIDAQSREFQRIVLHCIAFVFKKHHHHRDGQQHLRNRPQEPPELANNIEKRLTKLACAHQRCPQRQRKREGAERHGIPAKSVTIKMERAIEQRRCQPDFQLQINRRRSRFLAEYPACHVCPQAHIRQQDPGHGQRNVIPFQLERFLHQPGRDKDANCHRHQQERAKQRQ